MTLSKGTVTRNLLRYVLIFDKKATYQKLYELIWTTKFDPKDPDSGWAARIHKTVFPLDGENSEIIPAGSKGYLMDSTCNADSWNGNAYSYTLIENSEISNGDTFMPLFIAMCQMILTEPGPAFLLKVKPQERYFRV